MNNILEFIRTDNFMLTSFAINIVLLLLVLIVIFLLIRSEKKYIAFMKKLGNGNNLDEMLRTYLADVKEIKKDNS